MGTEGDRTSASGSSSQGTLALKEGKGEQPESAQALYLDLDTGDQNVRTREHFWQFWIPRVPPPDPPSDLGKSEISPYATANFLSLLWFSWITPIMTLGYQRTLQATDLWRLDDEHSAARLTARFEAACKQRDEHASYVNKSLASGALQPSFPRRLSWYLKSAFSSKTRASLEEDWRNQGHSKASVPLALNDTLGRFFWIGGTYKVLADVAQLMCPLLVREIINFAKERELAEERGLPRPNHCTESVLLALDGDRIVSESHIDKLHVQEKRGAIRQSEVQAVQFRHRKPCFHRRQPYRHMLPMHASWTAPIQVMVCLIILLVQLGPSALAGFALFLVIGPFQQRVMQYQFKLRQRAMKHTDRRAQTLLEALGSMRIVKYFTYESSFLKRIAEIREAELRWVRTILNAESANFALAHSVPYLAATLAFITYTRVKEEFDVAIIFSSLALFQLLRQPMMFLPRGLSVIADARSAFNRLQNIFDAELMSGETIRIDPSQEWALVIDNATFEWEETLLKRKDDYKEKDEDADLCQSATPEVPFRLKDITMHVPRGSLVAIVGRRENITFGQGFDEERYWRAVEDACLLPDLQLLADGDLTEIGEKGVNLSGGQKQRINIARALYFNADVVIMDDPLSAVDAHVGKALFHTAISALSNRGKTVILVTHALHFLSFCDYIYTLDDGAIIEQGTYQQLLEQDGGFARLDREFGGNDLGSLARRGSHAEVLEEVQNKSSEVHKRSPGKGTLEGKLIVKEVRSTGTISKKVWWAYFVAGRGYITVPLLILAGILMQGSQIISSYVLVWWQADTFDRSFSFYQTLYAVLGVSQAILSLFLGVSVDIISWLVSQNLHNNSIMNVFHAPMSFFDSTPLGRVIGIFGKDIDVIDNQLPVSMRMLVMTIAGVVGSVLIIAIVVPYFIIVALFVALGYNLLSSFYRASAREIKRLGLPTLRSYGQLPRFIRDNESLIDLENRALFLSVTNQRWLTVRLDVCGAALVFFVAFFSVIDASDISPALVGLILTFTTSLTQMSGMLMRQTAEVENYMNAVERVSHYSDSNLIPQEAPHGKPDTAPPSNWPERGAIEFKDVFMRYRPGLPTVLHGISMSIRGGEKIGVVGRTGAGKSSLIMALMRIVEYSGAITIDGIDISTLGIQTLRSKISIIPQEPTIFSGTVRTALDPFALYDDARLWDALRRSFLVGREPPGEEKVDHHSTRITLDTVLEAEGSNLSVGERSLLSLARALVKDTKVVVLDEATASVDLETDKKIQQTIQTQFEGKTLICIAHRLRTILGYDRVLVLDSGNIAEFDSPLALFNQLDGIFRGLCLRSNISENDILASRERAS
ncbi:ABC protein [Coprinopsis cinerea okayama7|uniref:ABC protein n=1 Tax=Coprinopsis cinerea (strain Okayama-7 / 130 / ATCC MYA-4618 / FGSC 9003) TaxID=240176 RepID=D6RMB4_COPC7|nr:ABC protein [Coprinopsis cinerea okayama7\|eukprot:XP_002911433.1 ABC protein [Coprinopsis cinerea okayama7\